ncbi:response regulator [Massilia sp. Root351]|jgi:two-component system chemotaxis response regulator CheY|uniref:response regulator n=1 Tax=Massilia sp. Root351 TaxID=1736522 RepID=UPI0009E9F8BA|nr:response regulator [Massilia sp. Root351]
METSKPARVLIIDDNELTRTVLRMIIQGNGYDVVGEASLAEAGLERALQLKPDIVCLDIQMPDRDGLEVLASLVARLPGIGVLMVSGQNQQGSVHAALARGALGFIIKPFNSGTVLDALSAAQNAMQQGRTRRYDALQGKEEHD